MKHYYDYQPIIDTKNKTILMAELSYTTKYTFESINIYPVIRLNHFRYIVNIRLDSISDYCDQLIHNEKFPICNISHMLSVSNHYLKAAAADTLLFWTEIKYNDEKIAIIREDNDLYCFDSTIDFDAFSVFKYPCILTESKEYDYEYIVNGKTINYDDYGLKKLSMREFNKMKFQNIHVALSNNKSSQMVS